jgi:hypothetical protein
MTLETNTGNQVNIRLVLDLELVFLGYEDLKHLRVRKARLLALRYAMLSATGCNILAQNSRDFVRQDALREAAGQWMVAIQAVEGTKDHEPDWKPLAVRLREEAEDVGNKQDSSQAQRVLRRMATLIVGKDAARQRVR